MSKNKLNLYKILQEVLNELGDFNNIKPFNFNSNLEFDIPYNGINYKAKVEIQQDNDNTLIQFQYDPVLTNKHGFHYYNINFEIDGMNQQAFKSNLSLYLQIMYTVLLIIQQEIQNYPNSVFVLLADDKNNDSKTKQNYYYKILNQNKIQNMKHGNVLLNEEIIGNYFINS